MELVALKYIAAGIGAGLTVIGAGLGLGKIGTAALEGTAMLGLVICLLTMVMK